ncbi:MAG: GMC family oxidoreductase N-terminal domain-containing protein [Polyangiales bacterium]
MNHISFRPYGEDVAVEADWIVIGSGAGGATAAVTLARAGEKVAIVEAGPFRDPADYANSVYGAMRDMLDAWGSNFTRGRAFWPIVQGCLVGGSTVINSAIAVRTPEDIFEQWEREHGVGGKAMAETVWRMQDDIERELCVEEVPPAARGLSNLMAKQAADKLGFESHYLLRYVKGCVGAGQCLQGCREDKKQSLNRNYVPEVMNRGGVVLSCAPAERVILEGDRAIGVRGRFRHPQTRENGAAFEVRAKKGVFVAASVTRTAPILMKSGVKNRALGQFFRAHPGTPVLGVYDDPIDMNTGATQGWASVAYREKPGFKLETLALPLDMLAGRLAGSGPQLMERLTKFRNIAMWVQACRAEAVGTIKTNLLGRPSIQYTALEEDMLRFREAMYTVAKMHVAAGARAILPSIYGMPYELAPDQIDQLKEAPLDPRHYVAILSHLFGGTVMGADKTRSVCDENGRVHDYENLYVADASVIPTNLGVNPQHTIMALARLFAERALA